MPGPLQENISFPSGAYTLSGVLHLPGNPRPPLVIGLHGLFADKSSPKQRALAEMLGRSGIAYLRFDHRGCGESSGDFKAATTFAGRCEDLLSALAHASSRPDLGPGRALFGSSMGGSVSLAVAARHPVNAIAVLAAPAFGAKLAELILRSEDADRVSPEFMSEMRGLLPPEPGFRPGPLLVAHAEGDSVVPVENGREIFQRASGEKKMLLYSGGDHGLTDPVLRNDFYFHAARWLSRRLA
ncbi:MAG: alpha/beta fold hydrolase [Thermodesulfobacteriota bacterium]